jgi:glycosyltransferase involved in cell wall biosynthesis
MKVVHLNTTDFGGAAMAARHLHEAMLVLGEDSHLLTLTKTRDDIPRHARVDPFALVPPAWLARLRYRSRRALERLGWVEDRHPGPENSLLRQRPPGHEIFTLPFAWFSVLDHPLVQQADVLHLHWTGHGLMDHADFFGRWQRRVVWTFHDMNPFTAGCHYAEDCTGYRQRCTPCPQLHDPQRAAPLWQYKREALAKVPAEHLRLVAPSRWLAGLAETSSLLAGRSCAVVPNGFDTACFKPTDKAEARRELGIPADRRVVLFSALDLSDKRKGMPLLMEALRNLDDEQLLLVRMGGNSAGLPGGHGILGTGHIASPQVLASYHAAADVFVLPSSADNLPNTVCEALLCGTPVVAFDVGGLPEQVVHGTNGLLVEAGDVDALRDAIRMALHRTWDRQAIAMAAARRYDRLHVARTYLDIYAA